MIGSTDRVRNLKRGHRTQVPASHSQYQRETQNIRTFNFHKPPHTPFIHKIIKRNTPLGLTLQHTTPSVNWIHIKRTPTKHVARKRPSYGGPAIHSAILSTC
ncbi:hypothetical protein M9H77_26299 [Catharanthus roseus]|uniref:Uncharacterized protein n=1 Tax=Catharanthus roseus TaxID=4058 RepID=A0ACC0A9R4_CATRO|nr:hypothetical protein M9H77_26299 [Catharanthus roseus]